MAAFDYVIVGAGSAGCVLADRLTQGGATVALLEAGGSDLHPFIRMPAAFSLPMNRRRFNWFFETEPEEGLAGRRLHCPRGKVLGGSSSINGMVYVRGHPLDFERWEAMGATGWGHAAVLPYFKKAERVIGGVADPEYRGADGPLAVVKGGMNNPLYPAFLEGCAQAGYALSEDLNGFRQEGFGALEMTVDQGVRCSTARAYLASASQRKNLTVLTGCHVLRVVIEDRRATGVVYRRGRSETTITARREVLLAAGAICSPQILLLSGIGAEEKLLPHGIPQVADLPGVGRNLMDHMEVYFQQECLKPVSLNRRLNLLGKGLIGARWLIDRSGLGATNHFEAGGFIRSRAGVEWPDIQFHFLPAAVSYDGRQTAAADGYQVHIGPMLSSSRGTVSLRSADPFEKPLIHFNYLATDDDRQVFRAAIRHAREIFAQRSFDGFRGAELLPGSGADDDASLDAFVRQHAESAYHPCGTCRMGGDDGAVVDPDCRVRGVEGLRVIDSSVFPHVTNGNINAPTIMLAEKAADGILGRTLEEEPLPYYVDPDAGFRQR